MTPLPEVGLDAIITSAGNGAIAAEARAIRDEAAGLTAEITAGNGLLKQAAPWADCPLTAADLAGTASCTVFTGYLPGAAAAQTAQAGDELAAVLDSYDVQGAYQAVSAVCLRAQAGEVLALLERAGFMSFSLPAEAGTMGDYIRAIEHKIADAQARIDRLPRRDSLTADSAAIEQQVRRSLLEQCRPLSESLPLRPLRRARARRENEAVLRQLQALSARQG